MIKELFYVRYITEISIGGDVWRLFGYLNSHCDHESLRVTSTPVEFDEKTSIVKNASGSVYHLNYDESVKDKTVQQIKEDIQKHGFKIV
jgi:hypothetical protein